MNIKLLQTYKQLPKNFKIPYFYKLVANNQHLFYFGANHSHQPSNKQYVLLEEEWQDFLKLTKNKKRIVFIEGGLPKLAKNKNDAIKNSAETGLMYFLAKQNKIKVISPEPNLAYQSKILLKKYSKDQIEYYYFARIIYQWFRFSEPRPILQNYIRKFLKKDKKELGWKNYDFSIKHMEFIHLKLFGKPINYKKFSFFNELINPFKSGIINKINSETARIRDIYIIESIEREWKKGNNIFITFGASHAGMQEKVIRDFVKNSK